MADEDILTTVDELINEENRLRSDAVGRGITEAEQAQLSRLEQNLDQCWDLLRQRRAHAQYPEDTQPGSVRPVSEVESYRQ